MGFCRQSEETSEWGIFEVIVVVAVVLIHMRRENTVIIMTQLKGIA